jgi:polyisoprenoid-binding protein YceI
MTRHDVIHPMREQRMSSSTPLTLALAAALIGAVVQPALAQPKPAAAVLQSAASEIAFTTRQMGVPVEGKFSKFSAQISLDPKQPETGSVAFAIDTGSARFGAPEIDAEVPKPTWLNVGKFPQATFQSSSIKTAGAGKFEVAGKLGIKGAVRDVVVPVQLQQAGSGTGMTSTASGSFTIKRLDFKVGEAEWADTSMLGNDVVVRFKLVLSGLPPQ